MDSCAGSDSRTCLEFSNYLANTNEASRQISQIPQLSSVHQHQPQNRTEQHFFAHGLSFCIFLDGWVSSHMVVYGVHSGRLHASFWGDEFFHDGAKARVASLFLQVAVCCKAKNERRESIQYLFACVYIVFLLIAQGPSVFSACLPFCNLLFAIRLR